MTQLTMKIIQAMEGAGNFFCTTTAMTSAPPVLPPALKPSAIEMPIPMPPASAAKIFSGNTSVGTCSRSKSIKKTDCKITWAKVRSANFFFTTKKASTRRGRLMKNTEILCGILPLVAFSRMMAIPVTPPMAKSLGAIRQ